MTLAAVEERTIMRKRKCKHCSSEIYLQYIPVTPTLHRISFEATDGKLHLCPKKTLDFRTRKLIQEAIDRMNYSNTTNTNKLSILLNNIDTIIEKLRDLKQDVIRLP